MMLSVTMSPPMTVYHAERPARPQRGHQFFHSNRLGEVIVHARLEAQLPVALHGVGGHGDDAGTLLPTPLASQRAQICRVASSPSISGICTSIRITS